MKPGIPWSVKGIGPEARDAAKAAARQSGMTVGEWLNSVILDQPDDRPRQTSRAYPRREAGSGAIHDRLSSLAEQLEQLSGRQQETAVGQYFEGQRPQSRDRASLETVLARLEANERHTIEAFESIHERLAGLDQQVAQPRTAPAPADDGSSALAAVETALRNIVDHIETSERRTHEAFHSLQARVSEVADRTRREETSGNTTDPHVLARLDSRLSLLAERIEEVRQSSAGVAERAQSAAAQAARGELRDIEVRIEQLLSQAQIAMRQTAGASGDLTKVRGEIGSLAQRLDDIKIEAASERDVHALRLAVEQLSNQVAQNSVARPIAEFDRRLAELAHRLEQSQTQPAVLQQIEELEQRMLGLDQHLSEAARREPDGEVMGMLERQLEGLSERLAATEQRLGGIATIEHSMSQLYQSLEQTRSIAQDAAEETATRTIEQLFAQMPASPAPGAAPEIVALEEALGAVQREAQHSDRQTQETLQAVHETLEQIVNKLSEIEAAQADYARIPHPTSIAEVTGMDQQAAPAPAPPSAEPSPSPASSRPWAADAQPRPTPALPLEEVLQSVQFAGSPQSPQEPEERRSDDPAPPLDYIAAARAATQAATAAGSPAAVSFGATKAQRDAKSPVRFFPFRNATRSRVMNGAAVPVEVLGNTRKRLILAGLVLLAAVSAYALKGVFQNRSTPATTAITVPAETTTGASSVAPNAAPEKATSPQSWLVRPDDAEDAAAGLWHEDSSTGLAQVIAGRSSVAAMANGVNAARSVSEVAHVQAMLLRLGFDVGMADGRMSLKTGNAIRLFQLQNGMAVNGEVGAELLRKLEQRQS